MFSSYKHNTFGHTTIFRLLLFGVFVRVDNFINYFFGTDLFSSV